MHTLQFTFDFLNFGNLINNEWGVTKNMFSANDGQILRYEGTGEGNVPRFSMAKDDDGNYLTETYSTNFNYRENWRLQVGVRYIF